MESLIRTLVLCCLALHVLGAGQEDAPPVVATKYGRQQGQLVTVKGTERRVHAFFGIPFAKPPVGELRFAPPQPPVPWNNVRDATESPPICLQSMEEAIVLKNAIKAEYEMPPLSEDCLYLNIFTPGDRDKASRLPTRITSDLGIACQSLTPSTFTPLIQSIQSVMVFIHGGGLMLEGATMYDGSALCAYENVVMVSIQYRLGVLGFFSTLDDDTLGNHGFLDQVAALQWVQENIADFGGDPQSVTIFGESAGGLSVSALVLSPLGKGLFHRAIAESGTVLLPDFIATSPEHVLAINNIVAKLSGCELDEIVDCLKAKTEEEIQSIAAAMRFMPLPGRVDGVFLSKRPEELLANKENHDVPFMIGVNNQECGWLITQTMNITGLSEGMDKEKVRAALHSVPFLSIASEAIHVVMEELFQTDDHHKLRDLFLDVCGDLIFAIPALKTAKYHRDSGSPVYFYEFQHRPSSFKDVRPDYVKADHTDEILSVFGAPFLNGKVIFRDADGEEEVALSKTVMKYWANFARTGDPNGPGLVRWPQYGEDEAYLEIDLEQKANKRLKEKSLEFWTKTIHDKLRKIQKDEEHVEL